MIGHQIYNYLKYKNNHQLLNISYRTKLQADSIQLDARNENEFINSIDKLKPNYIINCIGVLISGANKDSENAIFLNAYLPHRLLKLAYKINAKLIHLSTDCVFSGNKRSSYVENDKKDGKDIYAKTKSLGEIIDNNHLTLRTSVVGPELKDDGEELFHWFMNQSGEIKGFTEAIWSGVSTIELARAVEWAIDHHITGLYHITNNQKISKYHLLNLFKKYTRKDIQILPFKGEHKDKSFLDTRKLINYTVPTYELMISNMVKLIYKNRKFYSQYDIGQNIEKEHKTYS